MPVRSSSTTTWLTTDYQTSVCIDIWQKDMAMSVLQQESGRASLLANSKRQNTFFFLGVGDGSMI